MKNLKELFGNVKEYVDLVSKGAKRIGRRYKMLSQIGNVQFQLCRIFLGPGGMGGARSVGYFWALGEWVGLVGEKFDGFFKTNFKSLAGGWKNKRYMLVRSGLTV